MQAHDICEEHGSSLATYEQLLLAQNEGKACCIVLFICKVKEQST